MDTDLLGRAAQISASENKCSSLLPSRPGHRGLQGICREYGSIAAVPGWLVSPTRMRAMQRVPARLCAFPVNASEALNDPESLG